jgi:hypothetical protein
VQQMFAFIAPTLNEADTTLDEKIDVIATRYIEMLLKNPDLPLFVLSEIRRDPEQFAKTVQMETFVLKSHFIRQIAERKPGVNPVQFFISFLGMLIFPFIAKPVLQASGAVTEDIFAALMEERKRMIPVWIKGMLG